MSAQFPLKFSLAVPGQKPLAVALQRFAKDISDFTPFWNEYFVPTWYAMMAQQYATEGASTGEQWAPLSAAYGAWKEKHWPGTPIGVLTGQSLAALTSPFDWQTILHIDKTQFAVGTSVPHAIFMQLGTKRMVKRPPMRLTSQFVAQDVAKLLQKFGHEQMKKVGGP